MSLPDSVGKKKWLILLFILLWFAFMALIGYFIGFSKTNLSKLDLSQKIKIDLGKKNFKTKKAVVDEGISKTKKIDSKGGKISIVDKKGVKITLNVPPKALREETEIKLSSLTEPPLENYNAGENSPGVLIDPVNIRFAIPGTLIFDFNPENDAESAQPYIPVAGASAQNQPSIAPADFGDLTDDERDRRETAQVTNVGPNSAVVYTDSTTANAGGNVYYAPSERNTESSEMQTQTDGGGTYSYDSEVAKAEAKENINKVLNDPNSTFEQILEAGALAQAWGLDELDEKAKKKLKEKMDKAEEEMSKSCEETPPKASKRDILKWQGLAQSLGFDEQDNKFGELLNKCKGYFSFSIPYTEPGYFVWEQKAWVCGFIDDQWQGTWSGHYIGEFSGPITFTPYTFSLPPQGGLAPVHIDSQHITCCYKGSCSSSQNSPIDVAYYFDGIDTVSMPGFDYQAKINYQKGCLSQSP